jgi:hypothetical protein
MTADSDRTKALEERVLTLEKCLAELELRFELENPYVPWHVLAAAVAAVVPDGRIVGVARLAETHPEVLIQNLWSVGGRLDIFSSHRLR